MGARNADEETIRRWISENGGSPGGSPYLVAEKILNNDEIKALPSNPIELIPAPGTGKSIKLISAIALLNNSAGGYTGVTGASWQLIATSTYAYLSGLINAADLLPDGIPYFADFPVPYIEVGAGDFAGAVLGSWDEIANIENMGVSIADDWNGVADYGGGNDANTLQVTICYIVVDL